MVTEICKTRLYGLIYFCTIYYLINIKKIDYLIFKAHKLTKR